MSTSQGFSFLEEARGLVVSTKKTERDATCAVSPPLLTCGRPVASKSFSRSSSGKRSWSVNGAQSFVRRVKSCSNTSRWRRKAACTSVTASGGSGAGVDQKAHLLLVTSAKTSGGESDDAMRVRTSLSISHSEGIVPE